MNHKEMNVNEEQTLDVSVEGLSNMVQSIDRGIYELFKIKPGLFEEYPYLEEVIDRYIERGEAHEG
tara:strand:- start:1999 stop:2196 length:198 start_codon:yes stop_codon:yes gene_type:complete